MTPAARKTLQAMRDGLVIEVTVCGRWRPKKSGWRALLDGTVRSLLDSGELACCRVLTLKYRLSLSLVVHRDQVASLRERYDVQEVRYAT